MTDHHSIARPPSELDLRRSWLARAEANQADQAAAAKSMAHIPEVAAMHSRLFVAATREVNRQREELEAHLEALKKKGAA